MKELLQAAHELLNELRMLRADMKDLRRSVNDLTKVLDKPAPQPVTMYPYQYTAGTNFIPSGSYTYSFGPYTNIPADKDEES